jgi:hypothetical protein
MAVNSTAISVEWSGLTPCTLVNGDIVNYTVKYQAKNATERSVNVSGGWENGSMVTLTGLSSSTNYCIGVAAVNEQGHVGPYGNTTAQTKTEESELGHDEKGLYGNTTAQTNDTKTEESELGHDEKGLYGNTTAQTNDTKTEESELGHDEKGLYGNTTAQINDTKTEEPKLGDGNVTTSVIICRDDSWQCRVTIASAALFFMIVATTASLILYRCRLVNYKF